MKAPRRLGDEDYARLLAFRDGLRHFLAWSAEQATSHELTPAQHQLLLAVRGHDGPPSVGDVAEHLLLRHHSAVELVDRAMAAGLVERIGDPADNRIVRIALTSLGGRRLASLAEAHLEELARLRPAMAVLWSGL